jgi:Rrf2 family protein
VRFNRDVEYALMVLLELDGSERLVSAREISDSYRLPYGLLCKILQRLAANGVLESVHGAYGGYRAARKPEEITLGEIIDIVEGKKRVARCLDDEGCSLSEVCTIKGSMRTVQSMWDQMIASMTLREFTRKKGDRVGAPVGAAGAAGADSTGEE